MLPSVVRSADSHSAAHPPAFRMSASVSAVNLGFRSAMTTLALQLSLCPDPRFPSLALTRAGQREARCSSQSQLRPLLVRGPTPTAERTLRTRDEKDFALELRNILQ